MDHGLKPKRPRTGAHERTALLKRFGATSLWPQALDTVRNWGQTSLQLNQINQNALLNSLQRAHQWEHAVVAALPIPPGPMVLQLPASMQRLEHICASFGVDAVATT